MSDDASTLYGGAPEPVADPVITDPAATKPPVSAGAALYGPDPVAEAPKVQKQQPDPSDPPTPAALAATEQVKAAIPKNIHQLRESSERKLFSPQTQFKDVIRDGAFAEVPGMAPEFAQAAVVELREMASDMQLLPDDVRMIGTALAHADTPLTDEQRVVNQDSCINAFNNEFGQGAKQAWLDARKFVAADPRRNAMVAKIGDNPQIAVRIAKLAQQAKAAGRLK